MRMFRQAAAAARVFSNPATWRLVASRVRRPKRGADYDSPKIQVVAQDTEAGMIQIRTGVGDFWQVVGSDLDVLNCTYREVFDASHSHYYEHGACRVLPGDVVFDVGACEGFFTRFALDRGAKLVVAIEPWAPQAECLRRTFAEEIDEGRVRVVRAALADSVREGTLSVDPAHPEGASLAYVPPDGRPETVPILTLDTLVSEVGACDFLKADVEGGELALLDGAREALARHRPRVAMATYHRPTDFVDLHRRLMTALVDYQIVGKGFRWRGPVPYPILLHAHTVST